MQILTKQQCVFVCVWTELMFVTVLLLAVLFHMPQMHNSILQCRKLDHFYQACSELVIEIYEPLITSYRCRFQFDAISCVVFYPFFYLGDIFIAGLLSCLLMYVLFSGSSCRSAVRHRPQRHGVRHGLSLQTRSHPSLRHSPVRQKPRLCSRSPKVSRNMNCFEYFWSVLSVFVSYYYFFLQSLGDTE